MTIPNGKSTSSSTTMKTRPKSKWTRIGRCRLIPPPASHLSDSSFLVFLLHFVCAMSLVRSSASSTSIKTEAASKPFSNASEDISLLSKWRNIEAAAMEAAAAAAAATTGAAAAAATTGAVPYSAAKFVIPLHRGRPELESKKPTLMPKTNQSHIFVEVERERKKISEREVNFVQNVRGRPGDGFYVTLEMGTPPQRMNLLIDTGSSNLAVAGRLAQNVDKYFDRTKSSTLQDLGREVSLTYTKGEWSGYLVSDLVSLTSASSIATSRTVFTLITSSKKFFLQNAQWEGILGLAYASLSRPNSMEATFVDLVIRDNQLRDVFALQLCGSLRYSDGGSRFASSAGSSGHLALGGVDKNAFQGPIVYAPIIREMYYEVVIADVDVEGKSIGVPCGTFNNDRSIVDSGTTNVLLPPSAFNALVAALEASTTTFAPFFSSPIPAGFWRRRELMCSVHGEIDFRSFPIIGVSLFANENHAFRLQLRPEQYLRAVSDYGYDGNCYKFSVGPSERSSGSILGAVFMEGFYVVFDRRGKKVGFARNKCHGEGGSIPSELTAPAPIDVNITFCTTPANFVFVNNYETNKRLMIASYVMGGVALFLLGVVVFFLIEPILFRRKKDAEGRQDYEQLE